MFKAEVVVMGKVYLELEFEDTILNTIRR